MMESNDPMNQPSDETKEKGLDAAEVEESAAGSAANNRVWFWVVAALLFGGFIGWALGRQPPHR